MVPSHVLSAVDQWSDGLLDDHELLDALSLSVLDLVCHASVDPVAVIEVLTDSNPYIVRDLMTAALSDIAAGRIHYGLQKAPLRIRLSVGWSMFKQRHGFCE